MPDKIMTPKKGLKIYSGPKCYQHGDTLPDSLIPWTPKKRSVFKAGGKEFKHGERIPPNLLPVDLSGLIMMESDSFEELKPEGESEETKSDEPKPNADPKTENE